MADNILRMMPLSFPWQTRDPFLFCVHHLDFYPKGNDLMGPDVSLEGRNIGNDFTIKDGYRMYHGDRIPGFPSHPHRGFETVTIARQGYVDHSDSLGAAGRFGKGDVQWMTAGNGVQHSEMFPLLNREKENVLEIFQIWLNLPKSHKHVDAHFSMIWNESIPEIDVKDEKGKSVKIKLIAGKYLDHKAPAPAPNSWAADQNNEVVIWTIKMEAGASWKIPAASASVNRNVYFFQGSGLKIDGMNFSLNHVAEVNAGAELLIENGDKEAELLLLQGKPINEPVVQYGPFVVNTEEEIRETMKEFGRTQFGGWPWPNNDNVHDRSRGRFALYADGSLEEKPL